MKLRRSLIAIVAVIVATLSLTWSASASAGSTARTQRFLLIQTDPDGFSPIIIGTGPIHARGHDVQVTDNKDHFVFPRGTLIVNHHITKSHDSADPVTCLFRHTETGKYTIPRGTKAYTNVHGHGTYSLVVLAVGCHQNKPPKVFSLLLHASGPLSK